MIKKIAFATATAAALLSGTAFAADLPSKKGPAPTVVASPWDFDIGAGVTTDYIFRGLSQSYHNPSVAAHGELRYNFNDTWQGYAGISGESIKFTKLDPNPSMEFDVDGGVRGTFGALTTDVGVIGYLYPGLSTPTPVVFTTQVNWFELYGKAGYNITDAFNVGTTFFYSPSYQHTGANSEYLSATAAYKIGDFTINGEYGYQWLGRTDGSHTIPNTAIARYNLPSYAAWNLGASYTYKFVTLDLRYYGSSLSKSRTALITYADGNYAPALNKSGLAGSKFVAETTFSLAVKAPSTTTSFSPGIVSGISFTHMGVYSWISGNCICISISLRSATLVVLLSQRGFAGFGLQ